MKKYILVTGGELFNKGAQAMTFITVDQIAKSFPNYTVVLFSGQDANRPEEEKKNYKFEIMPFPGFGEAISLRTNLFKKRYQQRATGKYFVRYKEIFKNAVALIDISGYALGSNWNHNVTQAYLRRISLAKHFGVPVYLMPQSFGPFDFVDRKGKAISKKIKRTLSYAKLIMAREQEGFRLLTEKYKLKNVILTSDLVLQTPSFDINRIYISPPSSTDLHIEKNSVGIIPNSKNSKFGNEAKIFNFYQEAILLLLAKQKAVYLLYHAKEDLKLCLHLKETYFSSNPSVHVIEQELSCIDYEDVVKNFDFIIASRYHSIVHSYKNAVPAVVLGWAIKYQELTKIFGQSGYCFDVKNDASHKDILSAVEKMCVEHTRESQSIAATLKTVQGNNIFDLVFKDLKAKDNA